MPYSLHLEGASASVFLYMFLECASTSLKKLARTFGLSTTIAGSSAKSPCMTFLLCPLPYTAYL